MCCHCLLQGIFPTQGLNPYLLALQADSLLLSHLGGPTQLLCGDAVCVGTFLLPRKRKRKDLPCTVRGWFSHTNPGNKVGGVARGTGLGWGVVCLLNQAPPGFRTSGRGSSLTAPIPGRTGGSLLPGEGISSPANQRSGLRFKGQVERKEIQ